MNTLIHLSFFSSIPFSKYFGHYMENGYCVELFPLKEVHSKGLCGLRGEFNLPILGILVCLIFLEYLYF